MPDKMVWLAFYGGELTHWIEVNPGKLIYYVTHWMPLPEPSKSEE